MEHIKSSIEATITITIKGQDVDIKADGISRDVLYYFLGMLVDHYRETGSGLSNEN